jgi:hypothetical protein
VPDGHRCRVVARLELTQNLKNWIYSCWSPGIDSSSAIARFEEVRLPSLRSCL